MLDVNTDVSSDINMLYLTRKVSFDDFIRGELSGDNIKC